MNISRKLLIRVGKAMPFLLCFIVFLVYSESLFSLATSNWIVVGDSMVLNTPIAFFLANIFEYDLLVIFFILLVGLAVDVCRLNLMAILYLFINWLQKCFISFELGAAMIATICAINMVASFYFVFMGFKKLKQ